MKQVIILGSTGSIGTQTLEVIDKLEDFKVLALACGKNISLLKSQIEKYQPKFVCVQDESDAIALKKEYQKVNFLYGKEGLLELSKNKDYDIFVVATNGVVAVKSVLLAIENRKTIALANKETLVMAGDIVMKKAREYSTPIIPIDSEHSAILQCLNSIDNPYAQRLWITASGGPFLNNSRDRKSVV